MTEKQIIKMLENIILRIDNSLYEEIFLSKDSELKDLINIVRKHLAKSQKPKAKANGLVKEETNFRNN